MQRCTTRPENCFCLTEHECGGEDADVGGAEDEPKRAERDEVGRERDADAEDDLQHERHRERRAPSDSAARGGVSSLHGQCFRQGE